MDWSGSNSIRRFNIRIHFHIGRNEILEVVWEIDPVEKALEKRSFHNLPRESMRAFISSNIIFVFGGAALLELTAKKFFCCSLAFGKYLLTPENYFLLMFALSPYYLTYFSLKWDFGIKDQV